jgi:hypothetical protein
MRYIKLVTAAAAIALLPGVALANDPTYGRTQGGHGTYYPSGSGGPTPVPEPATMALMGAGIAGLVAARRGRRGKRLD